ncbi:DEAD/DEAH box helicase family protein [candidate division WOR-3 bacterium]|nr:DEAD/DEAH box helicase family protein [candidate division WOR-3 bacterium]
MFDIDKFKKIQQPSNRYEKRLENLRQKGRRTKYIQDAIQGTLDNLREGITSFIIYGDPQSGKTEMMIALTAKLLDDGHKIIVILLNDNLELLKQNFKRFAKSGINPTPKHFNEILDPAVQIGNKEWIVFCKKNTKDLKKFISKMGCYENKIVIDDEADYATPNAKININKKTRINQLVGELLGQNGIYIGVTATPARLDLNNTFENANDKWVNFPSHDIYTGQEKFFPINLVSTQSLEYSLELLPDQYDDPKYLRKAFFRFFVNVAYLNTEANEGEKNYCMLIHTSGRKVDHTEDYKQVVEVFNVLRNNGDKKWDSYLEEIYKIAMKRCSNQTEADSVTSYIVQNIARSAIHVMNSDPGKRTLDNAAATSPTVPFTIAIGGNIVSRGVTFNNLLSMFFTRDVKHKIQQDTYIQRARMFGSRGEYLRCFELTIPERLYLDWHRCFVFHRLALESVKTGKAPIWLEDKRVRPVSPISIDKTTVAMDQGEMSFELFDYSEEIEQIINDSRHTSFYKLRKIHAQLGNERLPSYLISFMENFSTDGVNSLAIHNSTSIANRSDVDKNNISRARGLIGRSEQEQKKYPHATHHIKIFYNTSHKARVFYKFVGNIKFIKNLKKIKNEKN